MTRRGQRRRPPGRRRRCRAEGKLRGRGGAAAAHHRRCALYRSQQRGRWPGWRSRGEHRCMPDDDGARSLGSSSGLCLSPRALARKEGVCVEVRTIRTLVFSLYLVTSSRIFV